MKKSFFAGLAFVISLGLPAGSALAAHITLPATASTTPKIAKSKLTEFQKQKALEYAADAAARLEALSQKQSDLIDRIDSRVRKFEEESKDVADAKAALTEAKAALETSQTAIESIVPNVAEVIAFGNLKEALAEARLSIKDAQESIVATHKKIGATIDALELAADSLENTAVLSATSTDEK